MRGQERLATRRCLLQTFRTKTRAVIPETRTIIPETRTVVPETRTVVPETRTVVRETRAVTPHQARAPVAIALHRSPSVTVATGAAGATHQPEFVLSTPEYRSNAQYSRVPLQRPVLPSTAPTLSTPEYRSNAQYSRVRLQCSVLPSTDPTPSTPEYRSSAQYSRHERGRRDPYQPEPLVRHAQVRREHRRQRAPHDARPDRDQPREPHLAVAATSRQRCNRRRLQRCRCRGSGSVAINRLSSRTAAQFFVCFVFCSFCLFWCGNDRSLRQGDARSGRGQPAQPG
jgi:hypothetical protein